MLESTLKKIEETIGYKFNKVDLLRQAFTRRSFTNENGGENNEILEFIGDKALELVVMKRIVKRHCYVKEVDNVTEFCSKKSEGELTSIKKNYVSGRNLSTCVDKLNLSKHIIFGNSDASNKYNSILEGAKEDLCEAIIGAVTIDCDWNFDIIEEVVTNILDLKNQIDQKVEALDKVILVQQWFQQEYNCLPEYMELSGPINEDSYVNEYERIVFINLSKDNSIENVVNNFDKQQILLSDEVDFYSKSCKNVSKVLNFTNRCYSCCMMLSFQVDDFTFQFYYEGESKARVRKYIATFVYNFLKENKLLHGIKHQIGKPNIDTAINQLQELYQKGYIEQPKYEFKCSKNSELFEADMWHCVCEIEGITQKSRAIASSKKNAKKKAAYYMLLEVYENLL